MEGKVWKRGDEGTQKPDLGKEKGLLLTPNSGSLLLSPGKPWKRLRINIFRREPNSKKTVDTFI
jgi:hypothetical protein